MFVLLDGIEKSTRVTLFFNCCRFQEEQRVAEEVPDAVRLLDALHRHRLLLLGHLLQGQAEQEERTVAHGKVSCSAPS